MNNKTNIIKRIVDICMTVLLLCLMAYQVTGEALHEWIGVGMTLMVIVHQILNRKWYAILFKGKYHPVRIVMTVVNVLLIASFLLTAFCGMSMSGYAVPFLYGMAPVSFVRRMHLSMSYWSFADGNPFGTAYKDYICKDKVLWESICCSSDNPDLDSRMRILAVSEKQNAGLSVLPNSVCNTGL